MEFDEAFKILLVGDSGVGKSSILLRFTENVFESTQPTIGVDFRVKAIKVDNRRVKMTVWDTYVSHVRTFSLFLSPVHPTHRSLLLSSSSCPVRVKSDSEL